jgi:hypothetical protein
MSASGDVLALAGEVISGISGSGNGGFGHSRSTYTTPADTHARGSCNGEANMLDAFNG